MAILDPEIRRGFAYIAPFKGRLAVIILLNLAGTALALYVPFLTRTLVDDALLGADMDALKRVVVLFVLVTAASFVLNFVSGMRYTKVSAEILFRMRVTVYRHLHRLSPRFFAKTPLGEIISRINNDVSEIQRVLADAALAWLGNVAFLAGAVGMLLWLDWRLFLAAAALLPPAIWAIVAYRRRLVVRVRVMRERSAGIGAFLIETLRGVRLVAAANAGEREAARFSR
ncbi:MAG: ABC transporter ATP-binding protein, partial [Gemmatimonadota bacterium]|nr:ABC transporter ATP-binding protein [Acidobacteriota bacterium]MDE2984848.1 ABC transporter ATP-binding protein [Gemmatimonadota bacterium]